MEDKAERGGGERVKLTFHLYARHGAYMWSRPIAPPILDLEIEGGWSTSRAPTTLARGVLVEQEAGWDAGPFLTYRKTEKRVNGPESNRRTRER